MQRVHRAIGIIALTVAVGLLAADEVATRVAIEPRPPRADASDIIAPRDPNLRVNTTRVLINATVVNKNNQIIADLEKEDFRLFEDLVEQEILSFSKDDAPLSVALVFDVSGSMGTKLNSARNAAAAFFRIGNPEDEYCLVLFNSAPTLAVGWTSRPADIQSKLSFTKTKGSTALLDGVYLGMQQMKKARNPRRAILIISDGADNSSRYTTSEVRNLVREADAQIYGIGIYQDVGDGDAILSTLARDTGGRSFTVGGAFGLSDIASRIGIEMHNQYWFSYAPINKDRDGKYRRVEVKVRPIRGMPDLRVRYRTGYYAAVE
jgi:VWFA-related protein